MKDNPNIPIKYAISGFDAQGKQTYSFVREVKKGLSQGKIIRINREWKQEFEEYWANQKPRIAPKINQTVLVLAYPLGLGKPHLMQRFELPNRKPPLASVGPSGIGGPYQKEI